MFCDDIQYKVEFIWLFLWFGMDIVIVCRHSNAVCRCIFFKRCKGSEHLMFLVSATQIKDVRDPLIWYLWKRRKNTSSKYIQNCNLGSQQFHTGHVQRAQQIPVNGQPNFDHVVSKANDERETVDWNTNTLPVEFENDANSKTLWILTRKNKSIDTILTDGVRIGSPKNRRRLFAEFTRQNGYRYIWKIMEHFSMNIILHIYNDPG